MRQAVRVQNEIPFQGLRLELPALRQCQPFTESWEIGLGEIGLKVAQRLTGFEMQILGYDPFANPDLVARLRQDAPLNKLDKDTLYGGGAKGYTDYPALAA